MKKLGDNEEYFRSMFEMAPVGMGQTEPHTGQWLLVNRKLCEITGYSEDELLGMRLPDMAHPDDHEQNRDLFNRVVCGEAAYSRLENRYIRKDGSPLWVNVNITVARDPDGRPLRTLVTVEDISQRKSWEDRLRQSEEKYRILVENANEAVYVIQGRMVKYLNLETERLFGYRREEVLSKPFTDFLHPDDLAMVLERSMARQKGLELPPRYTFRLLTASGETRWVELNVVRVMWEGQPATLNYMTDITSSKQQEAEKKQLEERLKQAEKMEALGTLAGGVAHDLNNMMGIVLGYAELLLLTAEEGSPLRPKLRDIVNAAQRAAVVVQDLLTLARRGVYSRQVLNLNRIASDFQSSPELEKIYGSHPAVKIQMDLQPDLLNISGSPVHLGKTLCNLVSNACEAMPKGGTVTIRTANRYLDRPLQGYDHIREGDYVVLTVSDTGEGISDSDLKRIFEPFYTKKVMGRFGSGLGLAVVWGTIKDHNGYINVQSETGEGSTFALYFPVSREELTPERAAVSMSDYMGRGESILVVDDVEGQRELAASILKVLNYQVACVSSGEEAVAYLKENAADLVILDMIMDPGMDGLDTYAKILEIRPKQRAIIVSGFSESDRVRATQKLGAGAYIRKPYLIEKLGLAVKAELL